MKDRLTYYRDATHLKSIMTRGGLGNQVIFVRAARVCMSCHTPVSFEMREHLYNLPLPSLPHTLTTFLTCLFLNICNMFRIANFCLDFFFNHDGKILHILYDISFSFSRKCLVMNNKRGQETSSKK